MNILKLTLTLLLIHQHTATVKCVINGQQCEDSCTECHGTCIPTPMGTKCKCPFDMTGDNCDLCLVKPLWFDAGNGYQYKHTDQASNYIEAQNQCKSHGGHLAIYGMRDPYVYNEIAEMFPDAFVGLTDEAIEDTFLWNDMVLADQTWTPWGPGEPSQGMYECCGYLTNLSGTFMLSNLNCSSIEYGLCEVPIGCPPRISKYNPKNDCEYFIIPPAARHVTQRLCQQYGGNLAVNAVNSGDYLKRILHHFNRTGQLTEEDNGVYIGLYKQGSMFMSDSGDALNIPNNAADWALGSPRFVLKDCLIASLTPDSLNYAWIDGVRCKLLLPGLCEICNGSDYLDQRTCKSGKMCPANTICITNDGSCFEDCICIEDYVKINDLDSSPCIKDKCVGYECGDNASCVFDSVSNCVSCKCDKEYLPIGNDGEGCFLDLCASGGLDCGDHSTCCIVDKDTKTHGCICDEGYYKHNDDQHCYDPCEMITCVTSASCLVSFAGPNPEGRCVCDENFMAKQRVDIGCIADKCQNGTITCGANAYCALTDPISLAQGCVCDVGFGFDAPGSDTCADCPQTKYTFGGTTSDYLNTTFTMPDAYESTLCAWITPPSGSNIAGALFSYAISSSESNTYLIFYDNQYLLVSVGSPEYETKFNYVVSERTFTCYIVSGSNDYVKLFSNGAQIQSNSYTETPPTFPTTGQIIIGQEQDNVGGSFESSQIFNGVVENLMLWDRVLTNGEILAMYGDDCVCSADFVFTPSADQVTIEGNVAAEYPTC